jgi:nucleotide-binding universal stress UspA family protein
MAYKNILVHVKTNEEWSPHVDYGFGIAAHFAARIVGMAIFDDIAMLRNYANRESRFGHERMAQRAVEDQAAHNEKVTAALKRKFAAAAGKHGLSHDFVAAESQLIRMLPSAARLHDLTILEQPDPDKDEEGHEAAEETALSSGRPLIIVPHTSSLVPVPEVLLLAWNGSREAAAALQGALPFLAAARGVTVLVGERAEGSWPSRLPQLDIETSLRAHVKEVSIEKATDSNNTIGAEILERADAVGAELIIMGAYGRPRMSELLLGGATRHVFRNARRPALMNH